MLATNAAELVEFAVHGQVWPVRGDNNDYKATSEGHSAPHVGMAGYCFTHRCGDPAFGWEADHLEPGASIRHPEDGAEHALHYLACMGNEAVITSGACAGVRGTVTGEHAHVLVDFEPDDVELLAIGDTIQITAVGTGLKLTDHPDVACHKLSPRLLTALGIRTRPEDGLLEVPVVAEIPSHLMGSGAELMADYVDQDFMTGDRALMRELGLDRLRLGDVVVVRDQDHRWGRGFRAGAVTIGLIIHGDSAWTGHGPGVLDLLSCAAGAIATVPDPDANLSLRLGLRPRADIDTHLPGSLVSSYAEIPASGGRA